MGVKRSAEGLPGGGAGKRAAPDAPAERAERAERDAPAAPDAPAAADVAEQAAAALAKKKARRTARRERQKNNSKAAAQKDDSVWTEAMTAVGVRAGTLSEWLEGGHAHYWKELKRLWNGLPRKQKRQLVAKDKAHHKTSAPQEQGAQGKAVDDES